jgi:hypothetical protein
LICHQGFFNIKLSVDSCPVKEFGVMVIVFVLLELLLLKKTMT